MMKLVHDEVLQEMEAVKSFIEMAISCQKGGFPKAAQFFLGQAAEDVHHTFKYAREIDKYEGKGEASFKAVVDAIKRYETMESGAVKRVVAMGEEARKENNYSLIPFLNQVLIDHSEEAYSAKKLLQQAILFERAEDLASMEDAFEALEESEEDEE